MTNAMNLPAPARASTRAAAGVLAVLTLRRNTAARLLLALVLAVLMTLFNTPARAGEGHDHGDAPATSSGPVAPRFSAHSDLFEAVGVLAGGELSILIDRYDSNEPVLGAVVEIESGGFKAKAAFHADHGDYSAPAESFAKPGTYAITLTVTAGDQTDLLAAELVVPDPEAAHAHAGASHPRPRWLGGGLAALLVLAGAGLAWRRHQRRSHAALSSAAI